MCRNPVNQLFVHDVKDIEATTNECLVVAQLELVKPEARAAAANHDRAF